MTESYAAVCHSKKKTLLVISRAQIGHLLLLFIVMSCKLQAETSQFFSWYGPCFRVPYFFITITIANHIYVPKHDFRCYPWTNGAWCHHNTNYITLSLFLKLFGFPFVPRKPSSHVAHHDPIILTAHLLAEPAYSMGATLGSTQRSIRFLWIVSIRKSPFGPWDCV